MSELTIAIVAYKNYRDVATAISSYKKYAAPDADYLVYIVDNSSGERDCAADRADLLAQIEGNDQVCYIPAGENLGFGCANNLLLDRLDSRYHAIVNPDIIFRDDPFAAILPWMDERPEVGMCIPRLLDEEGNLQPVYRRELTAWDLFVRMFGKKVFRKRYQWHTMQDMDYSKPFQVPFGQGSFLVIRTELFRKLHGFDEKFFMYVEDADLCKRVNQVSKLMYFPGAAVIHRWKRASHKDKRLFLEHLKSAVKYFRKWGWFAGDGK
ncbi:MAG: glycosyltransferase [Clostridiales bacterium]|nr:glycosyltransferase [Clostridiales bacterium]